MKKFTDLVQAYYDWSANTDILNIPNRNIKYLWSASESAFLAWQNELEDQKEEFTEQAYEQYQSMFQVGKIMLGFTVGCINNTNKINLYKLAERTVRWHMNDVLCSNSINILYQNGLSNKADLDGNEVELLTTVVPKTLSSNNISFDLIDIKSGTIGAALGHEYLDGIRLHNRLEKESWLASLNYSNGDLHLIRSNTDNEAKFKKYYEELLKAVRSISNRTFTNQNEFSTTVATISYIPERPNSYKYVDISGTCNIVGNPTTLVFSFDAEDD